MPGFRSQLNRLKKISLASSARGSLFFESSFEAEYLTKQGWRMVIVRPILIGNVVIFLVNFPEEEEESLALVYTKKDAWSDIEKESTGLTETVGTAIENYYSTRNIARTEEEVEGRPNAPDRPANYLLN
jgi:hypothetical protein